MSIYSVELSNLTRSDGSALMSIGETIVQAAVYGPVEVKLSKELCDRAVVEVNYRPKIGNTGCAERLKESHIKNVIGSAVLSTLHPRTSISVILQEVQDHGNLLSCCINSATLALLDAGLSMKCLVAAVTVALASDEIIPFPTYKQQKECKAVMTIAFDNVNMNVVDIQSTGSYSSKEYDKCLQVCKIVVNDVFEFFRDCVNRRYTKSEKEGVNIFATA